VSEKAVNPLITISRGGSEMKNVISVFSITFVVVLLMSISVNAIEQQLRPEQVKGPLHPAEIMIKPPSAPPSQLISIGSYKIISLTWKDNSANEAGFKIERSAGNTGQYTEIGKTDPNITKFDDTFVAPCALYAYRVKAFNAAGSSAYSNASASFSHPAPPQNVQATSLDPDTYGRASETSIKLTWQAIPYTTPTYPNTAVLISYWGAYPLVPTLNLKIPYNPYGFTVTGLKPGTEYRFSIAFVSSHCGQSTPSIPVLSHTSCSDNCPKF
jgi:hypothetical protein